MKIYVSILVALVAALLVYDYSANESSYSFITHSTTNFLRAATGGRLFNSTYIQTHSSTFSTSIPLFFNTALFANRAARNMTVPRKIKQSFLAIEQSEGAGARVRRSIGTPKLRQFSPFLMLDHFTIKPGAGFPDHPHRGQITYLLKGAVDHEDFTGSKGTINAGDLQFMTAGRGIMHAEMPNQGFSDNVGMQLWVDLPAKLKKCEPRYRDLRAEEIPQIKIDDDKVAIKIISGRSHGTDSVQELAYTPVWIFDVEIQPGGKLTQDLPVGWNAFAYTLEGTLTFGTGADQRPVEKFHNVVFEQEGDAVEVKVDAGAEGPARFILVAGQPLDQQVVQYGPFVLNSKEEVYQAMMDYQTHSNGFERAAGWESEIGKSMGAVA